MFVSRASKLAIAASTELASRGTQQWVKAEDLTNSIGVDRPFLLQIMNRLVRQGIVRSKRGRQGGFQMAVSPSRLTLGQIVCSVEGSNLTTRCLFTSQACDGTLSCSLAPAWHPIREMLLQWLNTETIQNVAERDTEQIHRFDIDVLRESMPE